jgi:hypothetical protein
MKIIEETKQERQPNEKGDKGEKIKIKKDGRTETVGPGMIHDVTVVYPRGEFSSVPSASKGEGFMTFTRKDSPPVHAGMALNIDGLTGDQVHIAGYSGVGYDTYCLLKVWYVSTQCKIRQDSRKGSTIPEF